MNRQPSSPQHRRSHGKGTVLLHPISGTDTDSFVEGACSNVILKGCSGLPASQRSFYKVMEATRKTVLATATFQGRKRDIKECILKDDTQNAIYHAGVGSSKCRHLDKKVRRAIRKACIQPQFNRVLFDRAWELFKGYDPDRATGKIASRRRSLSFNAASSLNSSLSPSPFVALPSSALGNLESAMSLLCIEEVPPRQTIIEGLLHYAPLDIETGIVMRKPQILRAGMVVTSLASRLYRGRTDIFTRRVESYDGPLIAFIMDMSGSMRGMWPYALTVMGAVAHTLSRAGSSTICVGFCASSYSNILYQFQGINEFFDPDRFHTEIYGPSGNADAVAVEYCRRVLLNMQQDDTRKKYIVVFSDETPMGMRYKNGIHNDLRTLNEALKLCQDSRVETISVSTRRLMGFKADNVIDYQYRIDMSDPEKTLHRLVDVMRT